MIVYTGEGLKNVNRNCEYYSKLGVCICMCVHTYIYMCVYIYTHTHTHTHSRTSIIQANDRLPLAG
jgi:hypothetical protein